MSDPGSHRQPTPQALVFTILGSYFIDDNPPVPTSVYLRILGRAGVTAPAARMTLTRMKDRGFLDLEKRGREAFWYATDVAKQIVKRQRRWTFTERATLPDPDDVWTVLTFSLPENKRSERDQLRQRLAWEGFGPLRDGVWVSPGDRDLSEVMNTGGAYSMDEYVDVFVGRPKSADLSRMIARAWHLPELHERYQEFLARWDVADPMGEAMDPLGAILLLITSWRQLARATPHLPAEYLPEDWPAARCMAVFRGLEEQYRPDASRIVEELTDGTPVARKNEVAIQIGESR